MGDHTRQVRQIALENAADVLRMEIASALRNGLFVVPVLVGGAEMPEADALATDIREIVFRNGIDISVWAKERRMTPRRPPAGARFSRSPGLPLLIPRRASRIFPSM